MRADLSRAIYRDLINGRLINKIIIDKDEGIENPLYDEILKNGADYIHLYQNIGYELHQVGDSFMIRDLDIEDQYLKAAAKVQVLIDLLSRLLQVSGMHPDKLTDISAGLTPDELSSCDKDEEFNMILQACRMDGTLSEEVQTNLIGRKIACLNSKGRLVLTSGGAAFYEQLHQ